MSISLYPSKFTLPQVNPGVDTVLEYIITRFADIEPSVWQQRIADGKVHFNDGSLVDENTPYQAQRRVYYYREVESEPTIPFQEKILFQDEHILLAYKPHFLALLPGGIFVNECLQNRLRRKTGIDDLQALHRLDRVTAGLVLFSLNPATRPAYHNLFAARTIHKTYQAIAEVEADNNIVGQEWVVKNRLVKSNPSFCMRIAEGEANSHSIIRVLKQDGNKALFELEPVTGKTHQLRVHMMSLGYPILNEKNYPLLQPKSDDDFNNPLKLLAKKLQFIDPISGLERTFSCDTDLDF